MLDLTRNTTGNLLVACHHMALVVMAVVGSISCGPRPRDLAPGPPIIQSFTAAPESIRPGDSAHLHWLVDGADSLSINEGIGPVSGTTFVTRPQRTTLYTLTARNFGYSSTATAAVTVVEVAPDPRVGSTSPIISFFTAAPPTIAPGEAVTLSWNVQGAEAVHLEPDIGSVDGTVRVVSPLTTTTYLLTARAVDGSTSTAETTIVVRAPPAPGEPSLSPVISAFRAHPDSVLAGESSTLAWSVQGADLISIDHGIGTVQGSSVGVTPLSTTTYTLTAEKDGRTSTATTTVAVRPQPPPDLPAPLPIISSFAAQPDTVFEGGVTTLSWTVQDADTISIDPEVGVVAGSSTTVKPVTTQTYTLTASRGSSVVRSTVVVKTLPRWRRHAAASTGTADDFSAAFLGDNLFVVGGGYPGLGSTIFRRLSIPSDEWSTRPSFNYQRSSPQVVAAAGKIYVLGGDSASHPSLEVYDPSTDSWNVAAYLPAAGLTAYGAAELNGRIYVAGGITNSELFLATVREYDPRSRSWSHVSPMPTGRFGLALVGAGGKLYALGGVFDQATHEPFSPVEEYDPATQQWTKKNPIPGGVNRNEFVIARAVGSRIFLQRGPSDRVLLVYDPPLDRWTEHELPAGPTNPRLIAAGESLYFVDPAGTSTPGGAIWGYRPP